MATSANEGHVNCIECGLHLRCCSPFMDGVWQCSAPETVERPILLVGESPGENEDWEGEPFIGEAGKLLRRICKEVRLPLDRCRITNAVRCRPLDNKTQVSHIKLCRTFLHEEIEQIRPCAILLFGAVPLRSLLGMSGITQRRREMFEYRMSDGVSIPVAAAFHPAYVLRNRNAMAAFRGDIEFFVETVLKNNVNECTPIVDINPTAGEIAQFHADVKCTGAVVGFDVEADTLTPLIDDGYSLFCIAVSDGERTLCLGVDEPGIRNRKRFPTRDAVRLRALRQLLEDPDVRKVAHNAKYDWHTTECRFGWSLCGVHCDTLTLHQFVFPHEGPHDLDNVVAAVLNVPKHKKMIESYTGNAIKSPKQFHKIPWPTMREYCGIDACRTVQLYDKLQRKLTALDRQHKRDSAPGMQPSTLFRTLYIPLLGHTYRMEKRGCRIDIPYLRQLAERLKERREVVRREVASLQTVRVYEADRYERQHAPLRERTKPPTEKMLERAREASRFNPAASEQIATVLFDPAYYAESYDPHEEITPGGRPSAAAYVLERVRQSHLDGGNANAEAVLFIDCILELQKIKQHLSTFVEGVLKKTDSDGFIHSSLHLGGARTGRTASSNPNQQNIPRDKTYRRMFIPPDDDWVLIEGDYSQIELRVQAAMADDPDMIDIYRRGVDFHAETARRVYGHASLDDVTDEQRNAAKTVNFSIIYETSAYGLARSLGMSVDDAADLIDSILDRFPMVRVWKEQMRNFAKRTGYVYTLFGSHRLLGNAQIKGQRHEDTVLREAAFRQAVNTPVQGTAGLICMAAYLELAEHFDRSTYPAYIEGTVHDSLRWSTPKEYAKDTILTARRIMSTVPQRWLGDAMRNIPIEVDFKISKKSWGDARPVKFVKRMEGRT